MHEVPGLKRNQPSDSARSGWLPLPDAVQKLSERGVDLVGAESLGWSAAMLDLNYVSKGSPTRDSQALDDPSAPLGVPDPRPDLDHRRTFPVTSVEGRREGR